MFCNSKFYLSIFLLLIISCQSIDEFETSISPNNITEIEDNLYLLSLNGSSRATAYPNLNKIDNIGELFFISWLGIDKNIFKPNITYFNIKNKKFGKTFIIDKSFDNHGVPSILVDKKNRINMFYYPHSHHQDSSCLFHPCLLLSLPLGHEAMRTTPRWISRSQIWSLKKTQNHRDLSGWSDWQS